MWPHSPQSPLHSHVPSRTWSKCTLLHDVSKNLVATQVLNVPMDDVGHQCAPRFETLTKPAKHIPDGLNSVADLPIGALFMPMQFPWSHAMHSLHCTHSPA